MCIIVDTNVAVRVFLNEGDAGLETLHAALVFGRGKLTVVFGGKNRRELVVNRRVAVALQALEQAGRARAEDDDRVDSEQARIETRGGLSSDDGHVLALAAVSGVRLLVTADRDLMNDFRDHRLVHSPRGKVYSAASHRQLIARSCR